MKLLEIQFLPHHTCKGIETALLITVDGFTLRLTTGRSVMPLKFNCTSSTYELKLNDPQGIVIDSKTWLTSEDVNKYLERFKFRS